MFGSCLHARKCTCIKICQCLQRLLIKFSLFLSLSSFQLWQRGWTLILTLRNSALYPTWRTELRVQYKFCHKHWRKRTEANNTQCQGQNHMFDKSAVRGTEGKGRNRNKLYIFCEWFDGWAVNFFEWMREFVCEWECGFVSSVKFRVVSPFLPLRPGSFRPGSFRPPGGSFRPSMWVVSPFFIFF